MLTNDEEVNEVIGEEELEHNLEQAREQEDGEFDCWLENISKKDLIDIVGIDSLKEMWKDFKDD